MNRNIWVIIITSAVFSICFGIYDFVLPLYLDAKQISFESMGIIFSISAVLIYFLRIYVGTHSDRIGRKPFYSIGLLFSSISNGLTPLFSGLFSMTVLKTFREASTIVRDTMRSILVFENAKENFHKIISKTVGIEFFLQGAGILVAGFLIPLSGIDAPFFLCGVLLFLTFLFFTFFFKENFIPPEKKDAVRFMDLLKIDLPKKLKILTLAMFIFNIGLSISHSFIMPLFFMKKFGASAVAVAVILAIHRMSLGLPMYVYGDFIKKNFKAIYIGSMVFEGVAIAASAFIPNFWIATIVWLTHDALGSAFWSPIQNTYIQEFARPESRGKDTSEAIALSSLGNIIGPLLAGLLIAISNISMPFFASGIVVALSSIVLIYL